MKNQYCGDVGDPGKFALLRSLQREFPEERIGILWYLTPDDLAGRGAKDGRFTVYPRLQACDPELYRALQAIARGQRNVSEYRTFGLTDGMAEHDEILNGAQHLLKMRKRAREEWFQRALRATADCSFVFLDPDNGIASDRVRPAQADCDKFALPSELRALHARGQTVVCYQHANRRRGGFDRHLADITAKFPESFTIRWHTIQSRAYLVWPTGGRNLLPWAQTLVEGPWREHFTGGLAPIP